MTTKEDKARQVDDLSQSLGGSQAVVFADHSGFSVSEMNNLRKKLSELGADFRVVKNALIRLTAKKAQLPLSDFAGPTAVLFSKDADPIESIKAVVSSFGEKGAVKRGIFEGSILDASQVLELAHLPPRNILEAHLVSTLGLPVLRLALALKGNQRDLVSVLSEIGRSKGGGA